MMTDATADRYEQIEGLADEIFKRMRDETHNLGFGASELILKSPAEAFYRLERDPADGGYSLVGDWLDGKGMKQGSLMFHADGSFFVEQDIVKPHPVKKRWFVEAVNAWGRDADIRAEARLLPMPE